MTQSSAVRTAGGLLTADLLSRLAEGKDVPGLEPSSFHLAAGETLRQAASRKWEYLTGVWAGFKAEVDRLGGERALIGATRERWLLVLMRELEFGRLRPTPAGGLDGGDKTFPVSHLWEHVPIHLLGWGVDLDKRSPGVAGAAGAAPQAMLQELLNRSDEHLWAVLANGQRLRLLRDSTSLVGSAYVEFDLEAIFDGELFSDFMLLVLLTHQSRFEVLDEQTGPKSCWLEAWRTHAVEQGTRALQQLRKNVASAIATLGTGFLQHPDNTQLRKQLAVGDLTIDDFQRTLLRSVYRLLFWFVAEDRGGLHPTGADATATRRYADYFSSARLRTTARRRRGNRQSDLWQTARIVLDALGHEDGRPELALPGIGGIFEHGPLDEPLDDSVLSNNVLLEVVRTLSVVRDPSGEARRPVDFRNLGAEELGSVYELLLELHPRHDPALALFTLDPVGGNERKTSGSYYTPTSLVECLLDSALDPLIDEALKSGDRETALLDLTVCDPACGSGHFLVAAARRIAKQIAAVRTGEAEPTPDAVRSALRDVIGRCIYGVDINPMAVEIAKIALWLEALQPGKPLSYLDANIRVGNALLGTTPALLAGGLPGDAFKPIEGDDKKYTAALAKRNQAERLASTAQGELFDDTDLRLATLQVARAAQDLRDRGTPNSLADIHVRARRHRELQASEDLVRARDLADAWCAAFVWPKTSDGPPAITHRTLQQMGRDPLEVPAETGGEIQRLAAAYRFFHWHLEFPQIFTVPETGSATEAAGWSGGFSCVLGNVPWERVKLQEQEFFAARDPEVAAAPNAAARKRLIKALEVGDPELYGVFLAARRRAEGESHLLRMGGRHPLTGRGDINTYAVFAETGRLIIGSHGRFGIILPTGIATDATTQYFFRDLVESSSLASLYDFENRKPLFEGVDSRFKFCLLTLAGRAGREAAADFAFFLHDPADLTRPDARFCLTPAEITLLNPNTGTCPVFRSRRDAEITLSIYRRVPVLVKEGDPDGNPWGISFMRMFDMSNDSHLFHTREQLENDGWTLDGNIFTRGTDRMLPLYEAKMLHHYDHRWATYEPDGTTRDVTLAEKQDPNFVVIPRYWVAAAEVETKLDGRWKHSWLLGWRDICRSTDERTTIASRFPRVAVGNNLPIMIPSRSENSACLQANLSSFVLDFAARLKTGGTHLNFFTYEQLPVLAPGAYRQPSGWEVDRGLAEWLHSRVEELVYTSSMRGDGVEPERLATPFIWNDERRMQIRAEIDAAYFHLYGIGRDDADYILDTFLIVKRKDEQRFGECRTKRLILEVYDAMAAAIATGKPYQTVLDPPPGHGPRHPERAGMR